MIGGQWAPGGPFNPINGIIAPFKALNKAKRVSDWARRKGINDKQQIKLVKQGWRTFKSI